MLPIVVILAAALITVIAINHGLRSDLKYYVKQCEENWKSYQSSRAAHVELLDEHIRLSTDFAQTRNVDGERLASQSDQLVKLRQHCQAVREKVRPQIELMRVMLDAMAEVIPEKYICPKCMCGWRDNLDGTMSLFDETCKACEFCEHAPLSELDPVRADGSVISDGSIYISDGSIYISDGSI